MKASNDSGIAVTTGRQVSYAEAAKIAVDVLLAAEARRRPTEEETLLAPNEIVGPWTCALHKSHGTAKPLRGCVHHVWPQGAGGPDTPANKVDICETGHANVHAVMWALVNGRTPPKAARSELALAQQGVQAWVTAGGVIGQHPPIAFMG